MAYALVCDSEYQFHGIIGAYTCPGVQSQMVIDPLVSLDPQTVGEYLAGGFALGILVFSAAYGVREILKLVKGA